MDVLEAETPPHLGSHRESTFYIFYHDFKYFQVYVLADVIKVNPSNCPVLALSMSCGADALAPLL